MSPVISIQSLPRLITDRIADPDIKEEYIPRLNRMAAQCDEFNRIEAPFVLLDAAEVQLLFGEFP